MWKCRQSHGSDATRSIKSKWISAGSSELNLSLAVDRADANAAVKAIHDEFATFPTAEQTDG